MTPTSLLPLLLSARLLRPCPEMEASLYTEQPKEASVRTLGPSDSTVRVDGAEILTWRCAGGRLVVVFTLQGRRQRPEVYAWRVEPVVSSGEKR